MAGYADVEQFRQSMSSSSVLVPCMKKQFGASYCPHCEAAIALFDKSRATGDKEIEKKGSSKYWKRMYFSMALLGMPGTPQNGNICLTQYPSKIFTSILDGINHHMPELRWPNPDSLADGRPLILQKFKKDAVYNDYKVEMHPTAQVLTEAWFNEIRGNIPNMKDNVSFLNAYYNWPAQNKFFPVHDMQVGAVATIRVLPLSTLENLLPFMLMHMHYVEALTKWDTLWRENSWNMEKEAEIMVACGYNQPATAAAGGYDNGTSGYMAGAPGPSGVAAPGLGALTGGGLPGIPGAGGGY